MWQIFHVCYFTLWTPCWWDSTAVLLSWLAHALRSSLQMFWVLYCSSYLGKLTLSCYVFLMRASCFSNTGRAKSSPQPKDSLRALSSLKLKAGEVKMSTEVLAFMKKMQGSFSMKNNAPSTSHYHLSHLHYLCRYLLEFRMVKFHLKYRRSIFKEVFDNFNFPLCG